MMRRVPHWPELTTMPHELWSLDALLQAAGGVVRGKPLASFGGVAIDSRTVVTGDIFVAITGDTLDGHDFVVSAIAKGAGIAIVSRIDAGWPEDLPLLLVHDDPLKALERIAVAARARSHAKIIAVTGSVGKTSTKELLRVALQASGETHASVASFNNHWGVPLTLSRFSAQSAFGVFEIGMNHPGEITPLVKLVQPHIAIITSIAASHLGHFKSLAEIADAKAEIFQGLVPGGHAVINRDTPFYDQLHAAAVAAGVTSIIGFGRHPAAQVRLEGLALRPDCSCITADVLGEKVIYKLGVPGEHMALNSLAVLGAVQLSGADLARAALALSEARPAKGRGGQSKLKHPDGDILLLDESYNANPASVAAALALLSNLKTSRNGRRVAVLGDMLELGEFGPELHRTLAHDIERYGIDRVFACGPLMRNLWDALPNAKRGGYAEQSSGLVAELENNLRAGDCVMVKGSLGSRMGPVVEALKAKWPEKQKEDN
jgi:UDP-N-acetylmuramoyl-tripeptide--D-alanyl-D-alanine ligase